MTQDRSTSTGDGQIDVDALKARYRQEREKRLRPDGSAQYIAPAGKFAHYLDDPFADPKPRAPVLAEVEAVQIGAGVGGVIAAVHLCKEGIDDFLILDQAGDFGGVWYWNRYPGVQCDIESYIYMPLLEETGYVPTEKYARGPEIFGYLQDVAKKYDLYRRALFSTKIEEIRWLEEAARWVIRTDRGDVIRARFVNLTTGPLQRPRLPGIPGIETFKGHAFHTSRWDYDYTGGDAYGGIEKLGDKRVGIIGTGATSVQAVPHLGRYAKQLYVFQRTPAPVPARNNRPTDHEWFKTLQPGWQRRRMDNFNIIVTGGQQDEDLVADGWTEILHDIGLETDRMGSEAERRQVADFRFMEQVRHRVEEIVQDKATAEALKPYYNTLCKRACFHDAYLQTFNLPSVTLVDTAGRGVERITENAVVVDGKAYEIDCLIYATGFDFYASDLAVRNGFEIYGRGGRSLTEKWRPGVSTLHGFGARDFPNCVFQTNAQGSMTPNITHTLEAGARHFVYLVKTARERAIRTFEPSEAAERAWVERIRSRAYRTKFDLECTPGYYNNEGKPTADIGINAFYPGSPVRFQAMMDDWRARGELAGMDVSGAD